MSGGVLKAKSVSSVKPATAAQPLECWLGVVCDQAICDRASLRATYVNVHERWTLPSTDLLGQNLPFQAHFNVSGQGQYEVRLMWVGMDKSTQPAGDQPDEVMFEGRGHFSAAALKVPSKPGLYDLTLEWRYATDVTPALLSASGASEWRRAPVRCPILVEVAKPQAVGQG